MKRKQVIVAFVLSLAVAAGSLYQTLRYVFLTPSGFVYPLVHNYEQDYYWYLSLMRQGWDGSLAVTSKYTAEHFTPVLVNTFFPLAGYVARVFNITLPLMYTLLRLFGGAGLLLAAYLFIRRLLPKGLAQLAAMVLTVIGAPLTWASGGQWVSAGSFWTGFDPVFRVTWLPHHTLSNMLFIVILLYCHIAAEGKLSDRLFSAFRPVVLFCLAFVAVWLNPATGLLIWSVFVAVLFWQPIRSRFASVKLNGNWMRNMLPVLFGSGLAVLLLFAAQNTVFPWTAFRDWERYNHYPVTAVTYLEILGATGLAALAGIFFAFRKKQTVWIAVAVWFLFPFAGIVGADRLLGVSNVRFLQSAGYIPAALLAVYGVLGVADTLGWRRQQTGMGMATLVLVVALQSVPAFIVSFRMQEAYISQNLNNPLVMVPQGAIDGLTFLNRLHTDGLVIAPENISILIPAFSADRVYAGHPTFTYNQPGQNKAGDIVYFYHGMNTAERTRFLADTQPMAVWTVRGSGEWGFLSGAGYGLGYQNQMTEIWVKN